MYETYPRRVVSVTVPWPVAAAAVFALLAALLVGGVSLLVQVHEMSAQLADLTTRLNALPAMNGKLDTLTTMDRTLTEVNGKLDTTNVLLRTSNAKLSAALVEANRTSRSVDKMQDRLGAMTRTLDALSGPLQTMQAALGVMQADIGRMTQKIVRAKLLF